MATAITQVTPWKPKTATTEAEVAAVVAMIRSCMLEETPPRKLTGAKARRLIEGWFNEGRTGALVARVRGGEIHGAVVIRNNPPAVNVIYVCAKSPRNRTGTILMDKVEELAVKHGLRELRTEINPADPVQSGFFVDNLGFEVVGDAAPVGDVPRAELVRYTAAADAGVDDVEAALDAAGEPGSDSGGHTSMRPKWVAGEGDDADKIRISSMDLKALVPGPGTDQLPALVAADVSTPAPAPTEAPADLFDPIDAAPKALNRASARAVVIAGKTKRRIALASKDLYTIGRSSDSDIVVQGKKASRRHCQLTWEDGCLFVADLGSSNGTFLNGQPVTHSQLSEGDVINVGRTRIGFDNLAVRSQPVELAGKVGIVDQSDTVAMTMRRTRPKTMPVTPIAEPTDPDQLIGFLRSQIAEHATKAQMLKGVMEGAQTAAQKAQEELADERRERHRLHSNMKRLQAEREDLLNDLEVARIARAQAEQTLESAGGDSSLPQKLAAVTAKRQAAEQALVRVHNALEELEAAVEGIKELETQLMDRSAGE